jgi:hypothetical protein
MQRPEQPSAPDTASVRARTLLDEEVREGRPADQQRRTDALAQRQRQRQEFRDEARAVRAKNRQARHRAAEVRGETNAILDTVVLLVTDLLRRNGFALVAPVAAKFRTADGGNTGVEVLVRLDDPSHAHAAKAAIAERFPDRLSKVIVS